MLNPGVLKVSKNWFKAFTAIPFRYIKIKYDHRTSCFSKCRASEKYSGSCIVKSKESFSIGILFSRLSANSWVCKLMAEGLVQKKPELLK